MKSLIIMFLLTTTLTFAKDVSLFKVREDTNYLEIVFKSNSGSLCRVVGTMYENEQIAMGATVAKAQELYDVGMTKVYTKKQFFHYGNKPTISGGYHLTNGDYHVVFKVYNREVITTYYSKNFEGDIEQCEHLFMHLPYYGVFSTSNPIKPFEFDINLPIKKKIKIQRVITKPKTIVHKKSGTDISKMTFWGLAGLLQERGVVHHKIVAAQLMVDNVLEIDDKLVGQIIKWQNKNKITTNTSPIQYLEHVETSKDNEYKIQVLNCLKKYNALS